MTKKYFKTNKPEVLAEVARLNQERKDLIAAADKFAAQFNAKAMTSTSMRGASFGGLVLKDYDTSGLYQLGRCGPPAREDKHLWTKPDRNGISHPRASIKGKELKAELRDLTERYREGVKALPTVDFEPFFASLDIDWGNLMFSGLNWFEHDDYLYFESGLSFDEVATEILGSEYEAAEKAAKV